MNSPKDFTMKKLIMLLAATLIIGIANSVGAQTEMTAPERAAKLTGWMKDNLQLAPEQVPKIEEINLKYANQAETLKTAASSKKEKAKSLKEQNKARDAELKQVFTTDQYNTYQSKKSELKKEFKEKAHKKKQATG